MGSVAIVDYGMCNLDSVARAVEECGGNALITQKPAELATVSHIILPGVGAFPDAMEMLRKTGMDVAIREQVVGERIPFLGICLGMQLMATRGFEGRESPGLDLIPGEVRRLKPGSPDVRIPHIGWNEVHVSGQCPLFDGIPAGSDFYFVHSYHFCCESEFAAAHTSYADGFVSAVQRGTTFGTQFHPEKSQRIGFRLLGNFLAL
jgi:glutamine amidotransferase